MMDYTNGVVLLAELLELLAPPLQMTASEAASLGLQVNWQKKKVQALVSMEDEPLTITVLGQKVEWLKSLPILAFLSTQQLKTLLISHAAMPSLAWLSKNYTIGSGSLVSPFPPR